MKQDIIELFICVDDFLKIYEKKIQAYALETTQTSKRIAIQIKEGTIKKLM